MFSMDSKSKKTSYQFEKEKGLANEERFRNLILQGATQSPEGFQVEKGTDTQDQQMIDFIIITQKGVRIKVNVKSSFSGMGKTRRKDTEKTICIIVMPKDMPDDVLRRIVIRKLLEWEKKLSPDSRPS